MPLDAEKPKLNNQQITNILDYHKVVLVLLTFALRLHALFFAANSMSQPYVCPFSPSEDPASLVAPQAPLSARTRMGTFWVLFPC